MSTCRGVDVSAYQSPQNWREHRTNGVVFAFAKASEGMHSRDSRFGAHMKGIQGAGLTCGAYHFGWPSQDPKEEADNYIAAVRPFAGKGFCHWLDLERYPDGRNYRGKSAAQIREWVTTWLARVRTAFPHQRVGVYTSGDDLKAGHVPAGTPLWYPAYPWGPAAFTKAEAATRPKPAGWAPLLWQFTSQPMDRSIAYMSAAELRAWASGEVAQPSVSLAAVVYGATHSIADEKKHPGGTDDITRVQDALVADGRLKGAFARGFFDEPTKAAYSREQLAQGFKGTKPGQAADGTPGKKSLTALGKRHGWKVVA
ncbi:glycoside hydrolase family 25 protein [Streptomyces sp. NRRL S-337]|uniref:glycoside hydrolase family 25 protein n=1 Tax=Streptomyces sp. NRRL S-337 TaxID=1463900 RepID=UPI00068EF9C1|nr:glycoside hydrolase family 25 protein [Streptomyces sp. NRRL S-337]